MESFSRSKSPQGVVYFLCSHFQFPDTTRRQQKRVPARNAYARQEITTRNRAHLVSWQTVKHGHKPERQQSRNHAPWKRLCVSEFWEQLTHTAFTDAFAAFCQLAP
eukprot:3493888-Rhodomonas_salina.1